MSIYINLVEQFSEKIIKQLFLISSKGENDKSFQNSSEKILENLKKILTRLKDEQNESVKLEDELRDLNSELFKLRIHYEDINKKFKTTIDEIEGLELKINDSRKSLEHLDADLIKTREELENHKIELQSLKSNISAKESEKGVLEQKRNDNEEKKKELLLEMSKKVESIKEDHINKIEEFKKECSNKFEELKFSWSIKLDNEKQEIIKFKKDNFFTSFLIDHSEEKIPELDIITTLIEKKQCNLDDLKNTIDIPPILAVRTIKQMALKQIIDLDEETNIVSVSKSTLSS
ncbi:MAG: hypothetical protein ACFFA6_08430 [Promethearchaeota archaeon]